MTYLKASVEFINDRLVAHNCRYSGPHASGFCEHYGM